MVATQQLNSIAEQIISIQTLELIYNTAKSTHSNEALLKTH